MAGNNLMVNEQPTKTVFSISDLTRRWGISRSLVYALFNSGALKSSYIGTRRLVTQKQLAEFEASLDEGDPEISAAQG
jgi:hypothetical protein